jgi:uncharacterized protein (DUF1330 family)
MPVYMVSAIEILDPTTYRRYQEGAQRALAPFKIDHLSGDDHPIIYEGSQPANHLNIIAFESQEKFEEFYNGEAYQSVLPDRTGSAETRFIMLMKSIA